jgi:hypothetical protein
VDINIITSFEDGSVVRIEPQHPGNKLNQQLWLGYYADVHYVSVTSA